MFWNKRNSVAGHQMHTSFQDMFHSASEGVGHLRDEAAETVVYEILKRMLAKYFHLKRHTITFKLSKGRIDIHELEFLPAARDMITESLHDADIPLKLSMLQVHRLSVENFFASDVVAGHMDHELTIKIDGVVAILQPCTSSEKEAEETPFHREAERKKREKIRRKSQAEQSAKSLRKAAHVEEENNRMIQTFLQTFELVEISKLHLRIEDPTAKMNMSLDLGQDHGIGGIKIFEPASAPKSFFSAHKENKHLPCPKQDCVKQVFFPMPVLCVNPDCSDDIIDASAQYDFKLQPQHVHVVKRGITYLVATVFLNTANLGDDMVSDITIQGLEWVNEMKALLDARELETVLHFAELLAPDAITEQIRQASTALDVLGLKITQNHVNLVHDALRDDIQPGLYNPVPCHTPASFLARLSRRDMMHAGGKRLNFQDSICGSGLLQQDPRPKFIRSATSKMSEFASGIFHHIDNMVVKDSDRSDNSSISSFFDGCSEDGLIHREGGVRTDAAGD
jgi:hypothetical protein